MVLSYLIANIKQKKYNLNERVHTKKHLNKINQKMKSNIIYPMVKIKPNCEKFIFPNHKDYNTMKRKEIAEANSTNQRGKTIKAEKNIFINSLRCLIIITLICPLLSSYNIKITTSNTSNLNQFNKIINIKNIN